MRFLFIVIAVFINFLSTSLIKSEENINPLYNKNIFKTETLKNKKLIEKYIHIVEEGDTLSSISKSYSIDKNLIIKLNGLKDENYIYVGQNLIISNLYNSSKEFKIFEDKQYHIVQAGENLTEISSKYKLKTEYLISINNINNPDSIKIGTKLLLNKNKISKTNTFKKNESLNIRKKNYGPLKIQNIVFEKKNGRKTLNVLNQKNKKLILSLRCESEELDVRIPGRKWRGWEPAKKEFEKNLIDDLC